MPGLDLYVIEYSSALLDLLSSPGGGVTKFVTFTDFHVFSFVFGL